jgi:hypothetical protein
MKKGLSLAAAMVILLSVAASALIYFMTDATQDASKASAPVADPPRPVSAGTLVAEDEAQRPSSQPRAGAQGIAPPPAPPALAPVTAIHLAQFPSRRLHPGPGNLPGLPEMPGAPASVPEPPAPRVEDRIRPSTAEPAPPPASRSKHQRQKRWR